MSTIHHEFEPLTQNNALALLMSTSVGRIGFVIDGQPYVLPVNYVANTDAKIVLRASETGILARIAGRTAFEVDGYDARRRTGWSVLILGDMQDITTSRAPRHVHLRNLALNPWAAGARGRWLMITAQQLTGRRVAGPIVEEWFAGVPSS